MSFKCSKIKNKKLIYVLLALSSIIYSSCTKCSRLAVFNYILQSCIAIYMKIHSESFNNEHLCKIIQIIPYQYSIAIIYVAEEKLS